MVRCVSCEKSIKSPRGKSWDVGMCRRCFAQEEDYGTFDPPQVLPKMMSNPTDMYLDTYTFREIESLPN